MPFTKSGSSILEGIERGGSADKLNLGEYKIAGAEITDAVKATSGYLYSGETITPTNYKKSATQIAFQRAGCRPIKGTAIWDSNGGTGTVYIHRYTDGAVFVSSTTARDRSGTALGNRRYLLAEICGGGGAGGGGSSSSEGGAGGGGWAYVMSCIRLPDDGYATLTIGGAGSGNNGTTSSGNAGDGAASKIVCGGYTATAGGGLGGYNGNLNVASGNRGKARGGGSASVSGEGADGKCVYQLGGGNGGDYKQNGTGLSGSVPAYAPENSATAYNQGGGATNTNGGGGGASVLAGGGNGNGGVGNYPGGGGGGGREKVLDAGSGASGAAGCARLYY